LSGAVAHGGGGVGGEEFGEEVCGEVGWFFFGVDVDDSDESVGEFAGDGAD
jgi:hypothetical protein